MAAKIIAQGRWPYLSTLIFSLRIVETENLETLAVDARGTAVSFSDTISLLKGLGLRDVHEQTPEAMRRFRLRLSIDPPSQFLQIAGRLCHLAPASP